MSKNIVYSFLEHFYTYALIIYDKLRFGLISQDPKII